MSQMRTEIEFFPPQDGEVVVTTCLDPAHVLLNSSQLVAAHSLDDIREILHEFEWILLLEEIPLLFTPLHECDGVDNYDTEIQTGEFRHSQVHEVIHHLANQMLPTSVGIRCGLKRCLLSVLVLQVLLVTLPSPIGTSPSGSPALRL